MGVGPRGLSALERVIAWSGTCEDHVNVLLVEPDRLGVGVHRHDQPDYLLLNTAAAQITAFSDERMVAGGPVTRGPSFLEWCRRYGKRVFDTWGPERNRPVEGHHFMPRRMYGEYLAWAAASLLRRIPQQMSVTVAPTTASDVRPSGAGAEVITDDGRAHRVDLALVTTGHGLHPKTVGPSSASWIDRPYPLPESVAAVRPGQRLALIGSGLTAVDMVAALTVGRGGRFRLRKSHLEYRASGEEPEIVLVSRSGWLPRARPSHPRRHPSPARTLQERLDRLREEAPHRPLDYPKVESAIKAEFLAGDPDARERRTINRVLGIETHTWEEEDEFHAAVIEEAVADTEESKHGFDASRLKQRLEILRDQREALRSVVDPLGLTPTGHREFFERVPSLANRTAVGPQRERLEELLCLIQHGIVRLGPGPNPILLREDGGWYLSSTMLRSPVRLRVDQVARAHLEFPGFDPELDLLAVPLRGWIAPHRADPRYLDLDRWGYPRLGDGSTVSSVAVFGPPAEGASYYNNYVLWPGAWSRLLTDIDRVVGCLLQA